jgi:hypothetical protein
MSLFDDQPNTISNLFSHSDEDEELNIYKKPFEEDTENFKYLPEMKEDLFEKQSPLFIDNENFINYFMKIDYNTPLNPDKVELNNSSKSESDTPKKETDDSNEIKKDNLSKKTKREKIKVKENFIKDNLTGIIYYEKDDPINYRKAKKRIQNRESAYRMKKMRENNMSKLDEEMNRLKEDNIRLIEENISLKKEKVFLIDQIKFMQKIIKESNLEFKLKNSKNKDKNGNLTYININKTKEPILYYDGSKQKIKGKLFNVFTICLLSIVYIIGECSFDSGNDKDIKGNERGITLNSIDERRGKIHGWYYISKIILFIIFGCIMQWIKVTFDKIKEVLIARRKKKFM